MLAMQYTIQLPDSFDTDLIRKRVDARSTMFDTLPGLAHKSFLFSEADKLYAPFYIWHNLTDSRRFLLEDLFKGVIDTFSRPRVRTWSVIDMAYGDKSVIPHYAVREADLISSEENLQKMVQKELNEQAKLLKDKNLHMHLIALDADRWEIVRYSLWKDEKSAAAPASDCTQTYEVLHVSEPNY